MSIGGAIKVTCADVFPHGLGVVSAGSTSG